MGKRVRLRLFAAMLFVTNVSGVWGIGLSTPFGLVTIENLQPGQTYNTRELASIPLAITNTSDFGVDLKIEVHVPDPQNYPGMIAAGFEPIPDASWISLSQTEITVQPGQKVATDVLVTIPDDDRYLGKKYQVQIMSHTLGKRFFSAGLNSTLRFTVAHRRITREELDQRKKVANLQAVDFDLLPRTLELKDFALGKKTKIDFKLSNTNNEDFVFFLRSVTPRDLDMTAGKNADGPPDPNYLTVPKQLRVKGNTIQSFQVFLEIPPKDEYRGKRYVFLVNVELPGMTTIINQVARIYVTTGK